MVPHLFGVPFADLSPKDQFLIRSVVRDRWTIDALANRLGFITSDDLQDEWDRLRGNLLKSPEHLQLWDAFCQLKDRLRRPAFHVFWLEQEFLLAAAELRLREIVVRKHCYEALAVLRRSLPWLR